MDLNDLKQTLANYYKSIGKDNWIREKDQLIVHPSDEVWNSMIQRNPTVKSESRKPNSSTALAINYFEMLAAQKGIRVDYEKDVAIPLLLGDGKGHPAMLDVYYKENSVNVFVESKFLEPYYSGSHEASPSYFIEKYYENELEACVWIEAFKRAHEMINNGEFRYYDINQMLKHLLAIRRTKTQQFTKLKNLIWKPEKAFIESIESKRSQSYLRKRVKVLEEEMQEAESLLRDITFALNWETCKIQVGFYNDEKLPILSHPDYETFKLKYLL